MLLEEFKVERSGLSIGPEEKKAGRKQAFSRHLCAFIRPLLNAAAVAAVLSIHTNLLTLVDEERNHNERSCLESALLQS